MSPPVAQIELARRLRLADLSREVVALELGVPRPTVSQIESVHGSCRLTRSRNVA